ncbi:hypothetical protein SUNI508_07832 [Seiridium unicorne]|uniref:Uncharacterized protein n=1 Tax=Seiridium unicorne TaxID=138068 RepID=A0ABR2UW98_9PEZI
MANNYSSNEAAVQILALSNWSDLLNSLQLARFDDLAILGGSSRDGRLLFTEWAAEELRLNQRPEELAPDGERAREREPRRPWLFGWQYMASPLVKLDRKAWQGTQKTASGGGGRKGQRTGGR